MLDDLGSGLGPRVARPPACRAWPRSPCPVSGRAGAGFARVRVPTNPGLVILDEDLAARPGRRPADRARHRPAARQQRARRSSSSTSLARCGCRPDHRAGGRPHRRGRRADRASADPPRLRPHAGDGKAQAGCCHELAWHGARIVAGAPLTFGIYLALYLAFCTLPLAAGLAMRGVFDALSGHAAAGATAWTFVALVRQRELAAGGDLVHRAVRHGVPPRQLAGRDAGWLIAGAPARAAWPPPGETVSRMRDDIADAMNDFMEAWIDLAGEALALPRRARRDVRRQRLDHRRRRAAADRGCRGDRPAAAGAGPARRRPRQAGARVAGFIADAFGAVDALRLAGCAEARVVDHLDQLNEAACAATRDALAGQLLRAYAPTWPARRRRGAAAGGGLHSSGAFSRSATSPSSPATSRWRSAGRAIGFLLARRLAEVSIVAWDAR